VSSLGHATRRYRRARQTVHWIASVPLGVRHGCRTQLCYLVVVVGDQRSPPIPDRPRWTIKTDQAPGQRADACRAVLTEEAMTAPCSGVLPPPTSASPGNALALPTMPCHRHRERQDGEVPQRARLVTGWVRSSCARSGAYHKGSRTPHHVVPGAVLVCSLALRSRAVRFWLWVADRVRRPTGEKATKMATATRNWAAILAAVTNGRLPARPRSSGEADPLPVSGDGPLPGLDRWLALLVPPPVGGRCLVP
jgi:hypothetical protein